MITVLEFIGSAALIILGTLAVCLILAWIFTLYLVTQMSKEFNKQQEADRSTVDLWTLQDPDVKNN